MCCFNELPMNNLGIALGVLKKGDQNLNWFRNKQLGMF
jgi:hypothetical protein